MEDAVEVPEVGVMREQHLLGGDEGGVEDGERGELGRGAQQRGGGERQW